MKRLLISILFAISVGSCNFLDVEPENSVTFTNYFKDEAEIEALFFNMFSTECSALAPAIPTFHDMMGLTCDEIYKAGPRGDGNLAMGLKSLDPAYFMSQTLDYAVNWRNYYDLIGLANMIIDNEFRFQHIAQDRTEFWLAQAWFVKGLSYFCVARTWGDAPIMPNSEYKDPLAKNTTKEVLEEALRCAEKALSLPANNDANMIDSKGKQITSKQYASLGTVYTLMANIYAWMGGLYGNDEYWTKAEECASKVIENKAGIYGLEPIETFCNNVLGNNRSSNEVIFCMEINSIDRNYYVETNEWQFCPGHLLITYPIIGNKNDVVTKFGKSGNVEARIKYETVKSLYPEAGDKRLDEFWAYFGKEENNQGDPTSRYSYINKWRTAIISINEQTKHPYLGVEGNKVIWRLADLMLLRAECRARLGLSTAVEDLNRVRRRAGLGNYAGSGDLRMAIFRERDRELIGEGCRYYDVVRNGYFSEISPAMEALTADDISKGAIYLPVSTAAFLNNSLMRQNTYWLWKK